MTVEVSASPQDTSFMLPGGVPSALQATPERVIVRGLGGRCWDQHGREYIDFICGYGPISLGHAHPDVNQAVIEQLERGLLFPSASPMHQELASALHRLFPDTSGAVFVKTGSEAVAAAIRLARAFTGKTEIVRCGFHGWHDTLIAPYVSWHLYEPDSDPPRAVPGVPQDLAERLVLSWDGVDITQLAELLGRHHGQIAALIIDPIQLREPLGENFRRLRSLTETEGVLLIADEIKTGFRVSLRGAQGLYGVEPDLTVLSKAIANGFPLAAVIGPASIMAMVSDVKIMGTYNNELGSIAAALATIKVLEQPGVIEKLWYLGQRLIGGVNNILGKYELLDAVQAVPYRWPSLPALWFRKHLDSGHLRAGISAALAEHGVLMLANHPSFICVEHTDEDIAEALERLEAALSSNIARIRNQV